MQNQSKILKWSLIIGIVIVLNLFFNYTLSLVYSSPDYNDFFTQAQVIEPLDNQEDCLSVGGQWSGGIVTPNPKTGENITKGWCDPDFTKRQEYDAKMDVYSRNVFMTLVLLGALCVALGTFLPGNMIIGASLSMAGVLSFIIASMRYWGTANDLAKVVILVIALCILFYVAMKKFKDSN